MASRTQMLKECGQSLWLDNIQRKEVHDGTIKMLIDKDGVCGITSNPTIFMKAVSKSTDYDEQIKKLAREGETASAIYHHITIDDIRDAGQLLLTVFEKTSGEDGFVSIELNPQHAFDAEKSIAEAREILSEIGLPNIMVKVPGTAQGAVAVRELIAQGLNVNITLLFSPMHYRRVALAYIEGLEARGRQGKDLSMVHSVASFFLSRIDTRVDKKIDALFSKEPADKLRALLPGLRGQTAIAVAKVTYSIFKELFFSERFTKLEQKGAHIQRPLWASTSTKDPQYRDVKYVEALIGRHTINTLPPETISAFRDHGVAKPTIEDGIEDAPELLKKIEEPGISLEKIYQELQDEGVKAFETSYLDLLKSIEEKAQALRG
ncbi:MAG: transaldolase [Proteobacteria bacterium]|nr:transaldolase [Pseudomonadota bacterium]